jgi:hypothetical protein
MPHPHVKIHIILLTNQLKFVTICNYKKESGSDFMQFDNLYRKLASLFSVKFFTERQSGSSKSIGWNNQDQMATSSFRGV